MVATNGDSTRIRVLIGLLSVFFAIPALIPVVMAQRQAAIEALPGNTSLYVVTQDPLLQFRTEDVAGGHMDMDHKVLRAAYRLEPDMNVLGTPEKTARAWLAKEGARFGIHFPENLKLTRDVGARGIHYLTFQQMFAGLSVYRRFVQVNMGRNGLPSMVLSAYAPHLENTAIIATVPVINDTEAKELVAAVVSTEGARISDAELQVYPSDVPRLVWRIIAWPNNARGTWEVLLDANTGAIIHLIDQRFYRRPDDNRRRSLGRVNGKGLVWDPDPLSSSGQRYGGEFSDNNDAASDSLNAERVEVMLMDIEIDSDNKYRLIGPNVRIDTTEGLARYAPPVEDHPDLFRYTRDDKRFEAVMAYYHIDKSQRYIQSLNLGRDIQHPGPRVNPHGEGENDNSSYDPSRNYLFFGDGGIDDAEDAEVILHEYGHAIVESIKPGLFVGGEGGALHEGFGDYWAVSYTRGLMDVEAIPKGDWTQVFSWVGNAQVEGQYQFRYLNSTDKYPEDTTCDNDSGNCNVYDDGATYATTMMNIWTDAGKEDTDKLILTSIASFNPSLFTMRDMAEAMLQADMDLFQGKYQETLKKHLTDRGYLEDTGTAVAGPIQVPEILTVDANYPNPFSEVTTITYTLRASTSVRIEVFNTLGQNIRVIMDRPHQAGRHELPIDLSGHTPGVYFLRITTPSHRVQKPLVLQ